MKYYLLYILLSFFCCSCLTMDIGSQTDSQTDFNSFKTYAWLRRAKLYKHADAKVDNDITEGRITRNVNDELTQRGLVVDTANPDILLDYDIETEQKSEFVEQGYVGNFYYNQRVIGVFSTANSWGPQATYFGTANATYQNGTVVLYVIEKSKNQLIWKAWADGSVENIKAFEKELPKDIHSMFKSFPIKPLAKKDH